MTKFFLVGGKLLGILCVYWALLTIPQIGFATAVLSRQPSVPGAGASEVVLLGAYLSFVASLLLGLLLLFKTERLAQLLKVPVDTTNDSPPSTESILRTGLVLVGVYILIGAVPEVTRWIIESLQHTSQLYSLPAIGRLASSLLRLIMALYIVVYSKHATQMIQRHQRAT